MINERQLEEIRQSILRDLPRVLEKDPQFVVFIEGLISERFPRRDEFARLLDEFTSFRHEALILGQSGRFFDQVDQRFDRVEQHLGDVDQRFDRVEQRLDA